MFLYQDPFLIIAKELSLSPKSNGHNLIKKKKKKNNGHKLLLLASKIRKNLISICCYILVMHVMLNSNCYLYTL